MYKRIIVVEDDVSIAEVLTIILEQESYRVETFTDDSFISGLLPDMPGLILMDMWLSGINGKDICLQLKQDPLYTSIPVIIMSANRDIHLHAQEACADDFLAKPFDVLYLISLVAKYMLPPALPLLFLFL